MVTNSPNPISPTEHVIRLLRPFFFNRNAINDAVTTLTQATQADRKLRTWSHWDEAQPHELYRRELLEHTEEFLFGRDPGSCRYLRVPDKTTNYWFKNGGIFAKVGNLPEALDGTIEGPPNRFDAVLAAPGVELFLSPHGVGVLSIALEARRFTDERNLREFNYRLCQLRKAAGYRFRLPYAPEHQTPPTADVPLEDRLGVPGGAFTLAELTERLTEPLKPFQRKWVHVQCSVYSVTRFGSAALFTARDAATKLKPFLYALAHIEEYHHVVSLNTTEKVLNPCHWVAMGSLGAAHLVADQDPPHPFDTQRSSIVLYKYFIFYLLSVLQRLTLQRLLREARGHAVQQDTDPAGPTLDLEALRALHIQTLGFNVNGYFTEVSSREVHNQYYELAQQGLRVQQNLNVLQRTLRDAEAAAENRFEQDASQDLRKLVSEASKSVAVVAHVQSKVEWLEVFFVSYYATALVYYVTANEMFIHTFNAWSVVLTPIVSGTIAFWHLRPDQLLYHARRDDAITEQQDANRPSHRKKSWFLILLFLIFVIWFLAGHYFFRADVRDAKHGPHGTQLPPVGIGQPLQPPSTLQEQWFASLTVLIKRANISTPSRVI